MSGLDTTRVRYYLYRASTSLGFYVPVSVLYLLDRGYGVEFVALMQAVFSVSLLLSEVPAGYLGDRIGRRPTLALGSLCRVAGLLGYVLVDVAGGYLLLKVLFGVGWALRSGTKDAWLYELLADQNAAEEYARVEGRGSTVLLSVSAAGAVIGGVLYGIDVGLPFLVNAGLTALGLPVLATMPATESTADTDERAPTDEPLSVGDAFRTLRRQLSRRSIRWVVGYTVLLFLVFDLSRTFEQPALDAVGIPVTGIGVLYAGFKLVSAGAAATTGWLQETLGTRRTLAVMAPVLGLAYATLTVVPIALLPVLFLYRAARTVLEPIRNQYLNDRLADTGRASVLSAVSMLLSLLGVLARLAGGKVATHTGPVVFLAGAGVALATLAGGLWLTVSPVGPAESPATSAKRHA